MPELSNITNLPGFSPLASRIEDEDRPAFLLAGDEFVVKVACGPLHSVALTNKGRLFACGYGDKHALGTARHRTINEFVELKVKHSGKVEKVDVGCSSSAYIAGGRAYITGTVGDRVFENFTNLSVGSEEVVEIKLIEKSVLLLTKRGEVYQMG